MKSKIHLVTRADDAGSCRSANEAILEGVEARIIKNVSFMAVGPKIEGAVELLGGRDDIAYGLHVCLNAEWEEVKWGPLTNSEFLTDEGGHFWPFPSDTKHQLETSSALDKRDWPSVFGAEINAQLKRLRALGLNISYIDEHMGVSWIAPELRGFIENLCQLHGLVDAAPIPSLPEATNQSDDFLALEPRLKAATGDKYVWITHPGKVAADMNALYLKGQEPGVVARQRDAERRLLLDPRLPELFARRKVKVARYDEGTA